MSFVFIFMATFPALVVAAGNRTICTVTLNSDDEKKLFQQKLQKDKNIKFVELTDLKSANANSSSAKAKISENYQEDWFENACRSQIKCDSLLISGHFAGYFFGKSEKILTPETLMKASCQKTCDSVLSDLKEVYLFGCNTLADKRKDDRTPEEYRRVLQEDGLSPVVIDRVVAARYSPIGDSYRDKMQKIFVNVPVMFGFDAKGPSGVTAKPFVQKLLNSSADGYSQRLDKLEAEKTSKKINESNKLMKSWGEAMAGTHYSSCSGSSSRTEDECVFHNTNSSTGEKLMAADRLLRSPERLTHLMTVADFINHLDPSKLNESDKKLLAKLKDNEEAKKDVEIACKNLSDSSHLFFSLSKLAKNMGWMNEQEFKSKVSEYLNKVFTRPLDVIEAEFLRDHAVEFSDLINPKSISEVTWKSEQSVRALRFFKIKSPEIIRKMRDVSLSSNTDAAVRRQAEIFFSNNGNNIDIWKPIIADLRSSDPAIREQSKNLIKKAEFLSPEIQAEIKRVNSGN